MEKFGSCLTKAGGKTDMATQPSYVPVLRWKQAEWMALRYLHEGVRELIVPVVEIPPSRFRLRKNETHLDVDDRLRETAEQLSEDWEPGPSSWTCISSKLSKPSFLRQRSSFLL